MPPITIVLIEDDAIDRAQYRNYLRSQDDLKCTVFEAETGQKGLELCSSKPVDCVLVDYTLPDMTGLEVIRALKRQNIGPALIMLTGQEDVQVAVLAMKEGVMDYVSKHNLSQSTLIKAINNGLLKKTLNQQKEQYTQQLEYLAHYDSLTHVLNRGAFNDMATGTFSRAKRTNTLLGVLYLDVDGFKQVNDSFGHFVGDGLLVQMAARLQKQLRAEDLIGRVGGDEFIIIVGEFKTKEHLHRIIKKIVHALQEGYDIEGNKLVIRVSLGVALYPQDGDDLMELEKKADAALYHAKNAKKSSFVFYQPDMA